MSGLDLGDIPVVHDGATEVVLVKPAGMPTEMRADPGDRSLLARVRRGGWPQARLPHRLDRVTSGLQVVARDADAVAWHNRAVEQRAWAKRYIARIGMDVDAATLLGEHRRYLRREGRTAVVVRSGGQPAFLVVEEVVDDPVMPDVGQVLVRLLTGRYHQIRVMLAELGAPLVGDLRYGGRPDPEGPWLEHAELVLPLPNVDGTARFVVPEPHRGFPWAAGLAARLSDDAAPTGRTTTSRIDQ